ncbi:MAG: hypothetical protein ACYDGM_06665 [Vulcanimicrobiaceae bacterium]
MLVNPATIAALDRISARAADVRMAFTPGAVPANDDVATTRARARFDPDPLCIAAPPGDYFITGDERGHTLYTRDGALTIARGALRGRDGQPIFGYAGGSGTLGALSLDPVDAALGRITGAHIERDGSLVYARSVIDPRTGAREEQRVMVGRVALARFPAGTKLQRTDASHFVAPSGSIPHVGRPADANFGAVEPQHRQESRVDIDRALARLKDAYLAFDALAAGQTAQWGLGKTAMDLVK